MCNIAVHPGNLTLFRIVCFPSTLYLEAKTMLPTKKIIEVANLTSHVDDEIDYVRDVVALLASEDEAGNLSLVCVTIEYSVL